MELTGNIQITQKALNELSRLGVGGPTFLRIGVIPGGCSGMTYSASVDDALTDKDSVLWSQDGVRVVADEGSSLFLDGLHIDYSDDLIQAGFRFKNPNAAKSCGCGSSFGV
jgi:iron-sulfur cluster assembly protein